MSQVYTGDEMFVGKTYIEQQWQQGQKARESCKVN